MIRKKATPQLADFVFDSEFNIYMISLISSPYVKLTKVEPQKDKNIYVSFSEKLVKLKHVTTNIWEIKL